jgi:hypothetical protein
LPSLRKQLHAGGSSLLRLFGYRMRWFCINQESGLQHWLVTVAPTAPPNPPELPSLAPSVAANQNGRCFYSQLNSRQQVMATRLTSRPSSRRPRPPSYTMASCSRLSRLLHLASQFTKVFNGELFRHGFPDEGQTGEGYGVALCHTRSHPCHAPRGGV